MPDKKQRATELLTASKGLAQATGYAPAQGNEEPAVVKPDTAVEQKQPDAAVIGDAATVTSEPRPDSAEDERSAHPEAYGFSVPASAAESDKHVMVGARVPEPMRAAIRTACAIHGMDVQTFCQNAFERELRRLARQG